MTTTLDQVFSVEDILHRHLLPFLTYQDLGRLECVSETLHKIFVTEESESETEATSPSSCWKILCERDYASDNKKQRNNYTNACVVPPKAAPVYSPNRQGFDELVPQNTWKEAYQTWKGWDQWMNGAVLAHHMVDAIQLWSRFKAILQTLQLDNVLRSFCPCPDEDLFRDLAHNKQYPSSLLAFYAVHGGQIGLRARSPDHEFFAGLFGSYACYNDFYSMRLLNISAFVDHVVPGQERTFMVGMSPGNPRMFLFLKPTDDDPEGKIHMIRDNPANLSIREQLPVVGHGGFLNYFKTYIERLENGYYKPQNIIDTSPTSTGICLFPDAGDAMSSCVTRGIEVRASARWFPAGIMEQYQEGLNFGYSIRIRMIESSSEGDDVPDTCQLVSRHWEFTDGNGTVRRVDGEAVIGKQPLFFRQGANGGYIDLGPAGNGERYEDKTFLYQSQSGPVAGTSQADTKVASVKGTFAFVPGTIDDPTGPPFHVVVAPFPLSIPYPFY